MISIIIPVYNQAKKLERCLTSLAKQTYKDLEIIIIDDGSKDDVMSHLKNIKCKTIRQENLGAPAARNRGYKESRGEYLFFCDADSILKPMALEIILNVLVNHPEASYVYSNFYWGRKLFRLKQFSKNKRLSLI